MIDEKILKYRTICEHIFEKCTKEEDLNETYETLRDNLVCEMSDKAEKLGIDPDTL